MNSNDVKKHDTYQPLELTKTMTLFDGRVANLATL